MTQGKADQERDCIDTPWYNSSHRGLVIPKTEREYYAYGAPGSLESLFAAPPGDPLSGLGSLSPIARSEPQTPPEGFLGTQATKVMVDFANRVSNQQIERTCVVPWLRSESYTTVWGYADRTANCFPAIDVHSNIHDATLHDPARDVPGEHFVHCAGVMALGTFLLRERLKSGKTFSETIREWCLQDLKKQQRTAPYKDELGCGHALDEKCVDFMWQQLALVHDVGYHAVLLHQAIPLFLPDKGRVYPSQYLEATDPLENLPACVHFQGTCLKVQDRLAQDGAYKGATEELAAVQDYVKNCIKLAKEAAVSARGGEKPYYPWFAHVIFGMQILDQYTSTERCKCSCMKWINGWIRRAVALHHVPADPDLEKWHWRVQKNPLAYLLKIVDEVQALTLWNTPTGGDKAVQKDDKSAAEWKASREIWMRSNKFSMMRFSALPSDVQEALAREYHLESASETLQANPLVVFCCSGPKGPRTGRCLRCNASVPGTKLKQPRTDCRSQSGGSPKANAMKNRIFTDLLTDPDFPVLYWPIPKGLNLSKEMS